MRVLVTGSSGRVGRTAVAALVARGDEVVGLDLAASPQDLEGFRAVTGAFDDPAAVAAACDDVDAVLHLGALMSWLDADAARMFAANVTGTFTILEAAKRRGVSRFVFASSGEVYPEVRPRALPIDESHPTEPISLYGATKLAGEELVRNYGRRAGLPHVILRFSHTQDAEELLDPDSFFSGPRFFLRSRIRQQIRFGNEAVAAALRPHDNGHEKLLLARGADGTPFRMTICDTRDLVAGILLALDRDEALGETFNLHPDDAVSFDAIVPRMAALTGLPYVDVRLPGAAVSYATSNAKARRVLGFHPQYPFDAMLADAVAAWRRRQET